MGIDQASFDLSCDTILIVDPGYVSSDGLMIANCMSGHWKVWVRNLAANEKGITKEILAVNVDFKDPDRETILVNEDVGGDFGLIGIYDSQQFGKDGAPVERLNRLAPLVEIHDIVPVNGGVVFVWDGETHCLVQRCEQIGKIGSIHLRCISYIDS